MSVSSIKAAAIGWAGSANGPSSSRFVPVLLAALFALTTPAGANDWSASEETPAAAIARSAIRLPQPASGQFIGTSGGALIVAGGQDTDGRFLSAIHVLPPGAADATDSSAWQTFAADAPAAWGASVSASDSLICVGGVDADGCSAKVTKLSWQEGRLLQQRLPDLPAPRAWAGAAVVNNVLYVVGGLASTDTTSAQSDLFALPLTAPDSGWRKLSPFPGPPRIQATVVGHYDMLHVFGGRIFDEASYRWHTAAECWVYRVRPLDGTNVKGWLRKADAPFPFAAAAAAPSGQAHVLLMGADRRTSTAAPTEPLAGSAAASHDILAYHGVTDTWARLGAWPDALVSLQAVPWDGGHALIGGTRLDGAPSEHVWRLTLTRHVRSLHWIDYAVIVIYFLAMAGIGLYFAGRQSTSDEFSLGRRKVKWWLAGVSLYATGTSALSYMAIPALTYATNLTWLAVVAVSFLAVAPQVWLVIPLIRRLNLTSTYEYLEHRFNSTLRLLASLQCIVLQIVGRMGVVLLLPALALSAVTGMDVLRAVLIMGVLTTFYTALGGIQAVIWTDAVQALVMLGGPLIAVGIILYSLDGGPGALLTIGAEHSKFNLLLTDWNFALPVIWIAFIRLVIEVVGFADNQPMVQRVLATSSVREARKATLTLHGMVAIGAALFHIIGICLFAYFRAHPEQLDPAMTNDQVMPLFVVQSLPAGLAGIIVAGMFAASMSTLSSAMNSVATLVSEDFYRKLRPSCSDRSRLRLMKISSYAVGAMGTGFAAYMATTNIRSMFETWTTIVALAGGGFTGVFILGMFSRRANSAGAIVGALASVLVTILVRNYTPLHWMVYAPCAVFSCVIIGYLASLVIPSQSNDLTGLTVYTRHRGQGVQQLESSSPTPEPLPATT